MLNAHPTVATVNRLVTVIVLAVLLPVGMPSMYAQAQDIERAAELAAHWSRIAYEQFESVNAYPSEMSGTMLERFIAGGAARAVRDRSSPQRLQTADGDIQRFAAAMGQAGVRQPDGRTRLGEGSFDSARAKVCPIYPFC